MLRIKGQTELLNLFREIDRPSVVVSPELSFPMVITDYLTWKEPSGHRTYLVVEDKVGPHPFGIAFEKTKSSESVPMMCNWCHGVRPASDVALMTVASDKKTRVGLYVCSDFSCKDNILDKPSIHDMRETLGKQEKLRRLHQKIHSFASKELF